MSARLLSPTLAFLFSLAAIAACSDDSGPEAAAPATLDAETPDTATSDADGPDPADQAKEIACAAEPALGFDAGPCFEWQHPKDVAEAQSNGPPVHGARGAVGPEGGVAPLEGRFTHGEFPDHVLGVNVTRLAGERGTVWIEACDGWRSVAKFETDDKGAFLVDIPTDGLDPGLYAGWVLTDGDHAGTQFRLLVVPADGLDAIVTDIDETLTTRDFDVAVEGGPTEIPFASEVFTELAANGYPILYLTARAVDAQGITVSWLDANSFPRGVIQTSINVALGPDAAKGKTAALEAWKAAGLRFQYAFGNAETDLEAFFAAGIPPERVYSINDAAGTEGTTAVDTSDEPSYEAFLNDVLPGLAAPEKPLTPACTADNG